MTSIEVGRCFNCNHAVVHVQREDGTESCPVHSIDAGGYNNCICDRFVPWPEPIDAALITIMRHLPTWEHHNVRTICEALGRPVPENWHATWRMR